jgi:HK97 gp10 family phage protein
VVDGMDVSGLNRLTFEVGELTATGLARAQTALDVTLARIERDAKAFVPVDTGNLRASISRTVGHLWGEVGPTAAYGAFVEFGTSRQGPAAYMGPAFDRNAYRLELALAQIAGD